MLELGRALAAGDGKGVLPVLRDGVVVAQLRASNWEAATALVGDREWVFAKRKRELTGRWSGDPVDGARLRARRTSMWTGTHRYTSGGRAVAESGSTGGWSPRPTLHCDEPLPPHHQVFLLRLELVIGRHNRAVMTAGVGVAVIGGSS